MASRNRNFRFVVWHESADPDWENKLDETGIPFYTITHNMDLNDDGTNKKLHDHVVIKFDSPKTLKQVEDIVYGCCGDGVNIILVADSISGAVQYLTHMNHPNKYQYKPEEVRCHNGVDYFHDITTPSDLDKFRADIQYYIEKENITSYYDLSWYATNIVPEWSRCINAQTIYWVKYLIAREDKLKNHIYTSVDNIREEFYK